MITASVGSLDQEASLAYLARLAAALEQVFVNVVDLVDGPLRRPLEQVYESYRFFNVEIRSPRLLARGC